MNPKLAKFLMRLYPPLWRKRCGVEFVALLESGKSDLRTSANVGWSAICERIVPTLATQALVGSDLGLSERSGRSSVYALLVAVREGRSGSVGGELALASNLSLMTPRVSR